MLRLYIVLRANIFVTTTTATATTATATIATATATTAKKLKLWARSIGYQWRRWKKMEWTVSIVEEFYSCLLYIKFFQIYFYRE